MLNDPEMCLKIIKENAENKDLEYGVCLDSLIRLMHCEFKLRGTRIISNKISNK